MWANRVFGSTFSSYIIFFFLLIVNCFLLIFFTIQNIERTIYIIHIDYSKHRHDYSDKSCELVIAEPKNGKHRLLPLTDDMRALLDRVQTLNLKSKEAFIFVREDGRRYTAHDISCAAYRRAEKADALKEVSSKVIKS